MTEKKIGSENFFRPLGVGDLWVTSVLDFGGEYPLSHQEMDKSSV